MDMKNITGGRELVMVSNRLPVDRVYAEDGTTSWGTAPGGLVTAVKPIVEQLGCVWVGWVGSADEAMAPFVLGSMKLVPVELSDVDIELYYEGFSNGTIWPLYHDVISPPEYHREWWEAYRKINQRFADRVAEVAAPGAIVWVHDYQLQLVPRMLRTIRPDLTIAFFLHIPFPPRGLFAQLPWRREIIEGILGADVIGFQRVADADSFRIATERYNKFPALGNTILQPATPDEPARTVLAQEFPISIDTDAFERLGQRPSVQRRAREIREELGSPKVVMLGVDRLDYTKGIGHRLKAYSELLRDGELDATNTVLVQVASPSRERVEAYKQLRDETEGTVGRINGEHSTTAHAPLLYLHRSHSREEMAALYLAADVLLVTPLRDGMNLVAKEYVACRSDEQGVLILSEFAGAADELTDALLVNPHDIEGLKAAIIRAVHMPSDERRRRMRSLRTKVSENDVSYWAGGYLGAVSAAAEAREVNSDGTSTAEIAATTAHVPRVVEDRLRRLAVSPALIVATDFDGTLSRLVSRPQDARILSRAQDALDVLHEADGVHVVLLTGRSLTSLEETGVRSEDWLVSGSHGSEHNPAAEQLLGVHTEQNHPTAEERRDLSTITRRLQRVFGNEPGVRLEHKPFGISVHTREVEDPSHAEELLAAAVEIGVSEGLLAREGKQVREFLVREADKGATLQRIRDAIGEAPTLFLGDDTTDEDVFRILRMDDLGIKVGPGDTAAHERVSDPETAAAVLALLAELRTGIVIGSESTL